MRDVSIVIPTCGRARLLKSCLESVRRTVNCDYEVIAIDGASADETPAVLDEAESEFAGRLVRFRESARGGFVRAANLGFVMARGRHVMWLNDDARPLEGAIDSAVGQMAASSGKTGLLAMFHRTDAVKNTACEQHRDGKAFKLLHVRGTLYANFGLARRTTFERLNYFDPRYFLNAADPDFSLKVWHAGLRVEPATASFIDHDEAPDARRADDAPRAAADNAALFEKWALPEKNPSRNDFAPDHPCTLMGLRDAPDVSTPKKPGAGGETRSAA